MEKITQDMIDTTAWEFEIQCPKCGSMDYAEHFISTNQCVSCMTEFNFYIEEKE